ncbi:MAG: bifunctional riboflavin kinase/FAD synthetase [Candidatus Omnitrophota bacterium]
MKVYYSEKGNVPELKSSIVAIGIFDGVHKGHAKIIGRAVDAAKKGRSKSVVITFDPHPRCIVGKNVCPGTLISLNHRIALLGSLGVDIVVVVHFTKTFAGLTPAAFVGRYLASRLRADQVFVGKNYRFGKDGSGDALMLRELGKKFGFVARVIPSVVDSGKIVSSTLIRGAISSGELDAASRMLGRRVSVLGTVIHGLKRGRGLGFPTSNIDPHHEVIPPSGVYAVRVRVRGTVYGGVMNIGSRPTFETGGEPAVEVHIFDFRKDIYGVDIEAYFIKKLREERKFKIRGDLIRQIGEDSRIARKVLTGSRWAFPCL